MGKSTISMAIFNSYFDITRGYCWLVIGGHPLYLGHTKRRESAGLIHNLMKIHSPARSVGCFPLGNPRIAAYDVLILQELIQSKVWNIQHWCILSFPHRLFHIWPKGMSKIHEGRRPTDFELATHQVFLIEHMKVGPVEPIFCKFQMLMIESVSYLSVRYPLVL